MQTPPCNPSNAQNARHWNWLQKEEESSNDLAYMSPSDDSVLSHHAPDKPRVLFCHVLHVILFADCGLAVTTDGETIKSFLLRSFNGHGRLAERDHWLKRVFCNQRGHILLTGVDGL